MATQSKKLTHGSLPCAPTLLLYLVHVLFFSLDASLFAGCLPNLMKRGESEDFALGWSLPCAQSSS